MKFNINVGEKKSEKELTDFIKKMQRSFKKITPNLGDYMLPLRNTSRTIDTDCLHDKCSRCHGTGLGPKGELCSHFIYCPCSKCRPSY